MALDRRSIERTDFPTARRGYDPAAVDAHLAGLAGRLEELEAAARGSTANVASVASEQVRGIVEAAEVSAAEIRERASAQAREQVAAATERAARLLRRIQAMEEQLGSLVAELRLLEGDVPVVRGAETGTAGSGASVPGAEERSAPAPPPPPAAPPPPAPEAEAAPSPAPPSPTNGRDARDDAEGARLVALNMALGGSSRADTDRYLAEHFSLDDRGALLDEVYATVEG